MQITAVRQVNDGWIDPLTWIGAVLAALGVVAALSGLIDTRPVQERAEGWARGRSRIGANDSVRSGSRRERRLAGSSLPDVFFDDEETSRPIDGASLTIEEADVDAPAKPTTQEGGAL